MRTYSKCTPEDLAFFRDLMPGRVLAGADILEDYAHDEMTEYGRFQPEVVLLAGSTEEIAQALRYCNGRRLPVTIRGAGTGLCGGCVPTLGGVLLSTEQMNRLLEIDDKNMTATVEPGLLLMEFQRQLEDTGLFYPPDPGEKSATLGGNAMTNAGGMRAVRYGVTRDYVLGMQVVLADGRVLELGGKIVKNASGYSLLHLMIGSEGTLGVLTRLTVKLLPEPKVNLSLLAPFEDLARCVESVPKALACGEPTAVEFMEQGVIAAAEEYLGKQFPDKSASAYLLLRLDGASRQALMPAVEEMTDLLLDMGAKDVLLADTEERKTSIWDARGAFLEAINSSTPSMDECDVVVPRDRIADFFRRSMEYAGKEQLRIQGFGHAGDGNLHLYVCKDDLPDAVWEGKRGQVMERLYAFAREMGGQVSGEHGIGHAKVDFLRESLGDGQMELMQGIKAVFDPQGILNPGKVVGFDTTK